MAGKMILRFHMKDHEKVRKEQLRGHWLHLRSSIVWPYHPTEIRLGIKILLHENPSTFLGVGGVIIPHSSCLYTLYRQIKIFLQWQKDFSLSLYQFLATTFFHKWSTVCLPWIFPNTLHILMDSFFYKWWHLLPILWTVSPLLPALKHHSSSSVSLLLEFLIYSARVQNLCPAVLIALGFSFLHLHIFVALFGLRIVKLLSVRFIWGALMNSLPGQNSYQSNQNLW